jgi:hypothetical protein
VRYRKLTADGDYSFGQGLANFWINTPQGVGQSVKTRLLLQTREWFLDQTDGTNYKLIIGVNTAPTRDLEIKGRILRTPGVVELLSYASQLSADRKFSVQVDVQTIYGPITVEASF